MCGIGNPASIGRSAHGAIAESPPEPELSGLLPQFHFRLCGSAMISK
jgi:hypothetical protein